MRILNKIIIIISIIFLLGNINTYAVEAPEETQTNYNIISEKDQEKIEEFFGIKEGHEKYIIIATIAFIIILILIIKTKTIENSTKSVISIAILGLASYILKQSCEGNIITILEIFVKILSSALLAISLWYIYKHDNFLIYIPIYYLDLIYNIKESTYISQNIPCKIILIIAPAILIILGKIVNIKKEKELLKPIKEKHERK